MRALLCSAALALTLGACGGSDDAAPAPMIGAAGGTASGPNGAQVLIPAGALAANTAIAVTASTSAKPALPAGLTTVGPVFAFTPHGQTFAQAVTVTVPVDPAQAPAGAAVKLYKTSNGAAGPWEEVLGATRTGNLVSGQVTGFSLIAVVAPFISQQPIDQSVIAPALASFSVTALGAPPFVYRWEKSDDGGATFVAAAGVNNTRVYTTAATSVAADHGDRYRVIVANDANSNGLIEVSETSATSSSATLMVTAGIVAPTITTQPLNQAAGVAGNARFDAVASGTSPTYQWQRSNDGGATWTDIAGATNASYMLANAQASDNNAQFRARASNAAGTATSNAATLTLNPPSNTATAKLAAAAQHSLALARNGTVYSWGLNTLNELGRASVLSFDTHAALIPALANVVDIATAGSTSLALLADGTLRSWGANGGMLGIGTTAHTSGVHPVSGLSGITRIAMGYSQALALRNDGTVWAWGVNRGGAVGDGTTIVRTLPVQTTGLSNVIAIAAGGSNSFALRADGTVWAWGESSDSPLLLGQGGSGADQLVPIQVQAVTGAVTLEGSESNAFARTAIGQMWAWGQGVPGAFDPTTSTLLPQLLGNLPAAAAYTAGTCYVPTSVNPFNYLLIAQTSGVLSAFGDAAAPAAGLAVLSNVTGVSALSCHALALRGDGTVWSAGLNNAGQLGDGTLVQRTAPVQVLGLNLN